MRSLAVFLAVVTVATGSRYSGRYNSDRYASDGYFMSWRDLHPDNTYNWDQAYNECNSRGYTLVSLDTSQKDHYISDQVAAANIEYMWTSGVRGYDGYFRWGTGEKVNDRYYTNWSPTGFNKQPQPDNLEDPEDCLAILNNVYRDGVKWHDINCARVKHFVCEKPY